MLSNTPPVYYRHYLVNTCVTVGGLYNWTCLDEGDVTEIHLGTPAHSLQVGDWVHISNITPTGGPDAYVEVIATTTFTITVPKVNNITIYDTGTAIKLEKREVKPRNWHQTKYIWQADRVRWRKKLNGRLLFTAADYNYLYAQMQANPCCELKFIVERKCAGGWTRDWLGYFTHNMGFWNESHCQVEMEFEPDDAYRCLNNNLTQRYNIAELPFMDPITVPYEVTYEEVSCCDYLILDVFQVLEPECPDPATRVFDRSGIIDPNVVVTDCIDNMANWFLKDWTAEWTGNYLSGGSEAEYYVCNTWIREIATTLDVAGNPSPPPGSGWVENGATTVGGLAAHDWYRMPYGEDNVNYPTASFTKEWVSGEDCKLHIFANFPDDIDDYGYFRELPVILAHLATAACPKVAGIRSDFFEINPPADTPGYTTGVNYVTGVANKLRYLAISEKRDFIDLVLSVSAQPLVELSLGELLTALCETFNADWFVDADYFLRIEHVSWFNRVVVLDTTTGQARLFNDGMKRYSFTRGEIPVREEYTFTDQANIDFVGKPILYSPPCPTEGKVTVHSAAPFTTDVRQLQNNPNDVERSGFVLIVYNGANIDTEVGELTGVSGNNKHLSWANLHDAYHRHLRPLINGNMNGVATTFETAQRSKLQSGIKYKNCCEEIEPMLALVATQLGNGQIMSMEKNNRTEDYVFNLLHS